MRSLRKNQQRKRKHKYNYLKSSGGELNSDSGFGLQTELVSSEPGEDVRFSYTWVSDQNDLEQIVILVVHSMRHGSFPLRSLQPPARSNTKYSFRSQNHTRIKIRTKNHTRETTQRIYLASTNWIGKKKKLTTRRIDWLIRDLDELVNGMRSVKFRVVN